jgi:hypothetical protein
VAAAAAAAGLLLALPGHRPTGPAPRAATPAATAGHSASKSASPGQALPPGQHLERDSCLARSGACSYWPLPGTWQCLLVLAAARLAAVPARAGRCQARSLRMGRASRPRATVSGGWPSFGPKTQPAPYVILAADYMGCGPSSSGAGQEGSGRDCPLSAPGRPPVWRQAGPVQGGRRVGAPGVGAPGLGAKRTAVN